MIKQLEIGEHVDLDSGIEITRTSNEIYKVKDLEDDSTVFLNDTEIRQLAQLAGFVCRERSEFDAW